ncbi:MAG: hypothetical protein LBV50_02980, partial [Novosphingobium sp.]|nr:hypothetical protein [Novosphingobium sp.]
MKNTLASELPRYWSSQPDGQGGVLLCYAVREGALRWALIAIGLALVAGGIRFAFWLMQGGVGFEDLTLPFLLILTLGSGGLL